MNRLRIDLENCYGIRRLKTQLDFSQGNAYALYAPNGMMKSSLAQAFKDIATQTVSRDRVFPHRATRRDVIDESGNALTANAVLVLPPYDEVFGNSEKTAVLLVDAKLRREYERLYLEATSAKDRFLQAMKKHSKSRRDIEAEICDVFPASHGSIYEALVNAKPDVDALLEPQFANISYDLLADEKVASFLANNEVEAVLTAYIDQYNQLLARSKYFQKGTFDFYNAATIAKALAGNGFFKAKHSVTLNADSRIEVTTEKELADVIAREKAAILRDDNLRKTFDEMEKRINRNESLRDLQQFIADNEQVLVLMGDMPKLKQDVWKSYFKAHAALFNDVIARYEEASNRGREIEAEAARQRTQWENVIEIFNKRFFVPFKIEATNKVSVMLGDDVAPSLAFTFHDGNDSALIDRSDLLQVLSTGEKKALYILNIIFEVEVRRAAGTDTVFVVDDIADSFDYKNKYAIIQYLKDISDEQHFKQIILTHNFDFFRTINSRFVRYSHCLMAQRSSEGIELVPAAGIKNVFINDWKAHFFDDSRKRVAAISFVRNIVEYTRGDDDPDFVALTALLHWKPETATLTHRELDTIYNRTFRGGGGWAKPDTCVIDTIRSEAEACLTAPQGANFENKIVLAIAIRLTAEQHMLARIADGAFAAGITSNQTSMLVRKYKSLAGIEQKAMDILDQVALMTPENIHLNSFMYEPIVDMSDDRLRTLYSEVRALA